MLLQGHTYLPAKPGKVLFSEAVMYPSKTLQASRFHYQKDKGRLYGAVGA